jgi:phosphohistidine phosphatase SixA
MPFTFHENTVTLSNPAAVPAPTVGAPGFALILGSAGLFRWWPSTARRARQTWERLATALPAPPRVVYEDRLYNQSVAARRLVASGDVETRERLDEGLPTSGLAVMDFAGKNWRKCIPTADGLSAS